jgi:hypothetical protein
MEIRSCNPVLVGLASPFAIQSLEDEQEEVMLLLRRAGVEVVAGQKSCSC